MSSETSFKMLRWAHLPECTSPIDGWHVKQFTDIAKVIAGQSPSSETYNDKGNGLPFLQGNADFSFKYPKPELWSSAPVRTAEENDTLISVRAPVGEVNRADQSYAIGRGLAAIRAFGADADFIYHALQRWRWSLQRVAQGSTFDAVTAKHFAQLFVALPCDSDEQTAIAYSLDAVDTSIERARKAVDEVKNLRKTVIQDFFYAALGVTAYADRPTKELPAGWSLRTTESLLVADPKNGVSPKASSQPPGVPTFSIAAIRDGRLDLSTDANLKYAEVPAKVAAKFTLNIGDVLIVRGNANPDFVGKACMVKDFPEGCIYPDITKRVVFRTEGENTVTPEYAVMAWNNPVVHNQILRRAKTSNGTLKINNRDVKQIIMPVPPTGMQQTIVNLVAAAEAKTDALICKLKALEQLKRSLMHDLLTGTVRVDPALFKETTSL